MTKDQLTSLDPSFSSVDPDCPICMTLMAEPCILPCGHFTCASCAWQILCSKHQCPFDRSKISNDLVIKVHKGMQSQIRQANQEAWVKRMEELKQREQLVAGLYFFKLEIGHKFEILKNPKLVKVGHNGFKLMKYRWTLFLKGAGHQNQALADRLIDKIEVSLNPLCVQDRPSKLK